MNFIHLTPICGTGTEIWLHYRTIAILTSPHSLDIHLHEHHDDASRWVGDEFCFTILLFVVFCVKDMLCSHFSWTMNHWKLEERICSFSLSKRVGKVSSSDRIWARWWYQLWAQSSGLGQARTWIWSRMSKGTFLPQSKRNWILVEVKGWRWHYCILIMMGRTNLGKNEGQNWRARTHTEKYKYDGDGDNNGNVCYIVLDGLDSLPSWDHPSGNVRVGTLPVMMTAMAMGWGLLHSCRIMEMRAAAGMGMGMGTNGVLPVSWATMKCKHWRNHSETFGNDNFAKSMGLDTSSTSGCHRWMETQSLQQCGLQIRQFLQIIKRHRWGWRFRWWEDAFNFGKTFGQNLRVLWKRIQTPWEKVACGITAYQNMWRWIHTITI